MRTVIPHYNKVLFIPLSYISPKQIMECACDCVFNMTFVLLAVFSYTSTSFPNNYPLILSREVLSQEVPYLGGNAEMNFYVEGLHFPDKDFNGLISINLSVLEPISAVGIIFLTLPIIELLCCLLYCQLTKTPNCIIKKNIILFLFHLNLPC